MDPFDNDPLAPVRARFPEADWLAAEIVRDEKSTGVWINGTASYAYVEVLRNGRIHYYYEATKNGKAVEGVVATADELPDALGLAMAAQDASRGMLTAKRAGRPLKPQSDRPCETALTTPIRASSAQSKSRIATKHDGAPVTASNPDPAQRQRRTNASKRLLARFERNATRARA